MQHNSFQKILVIQTASIGDVVLMTPVLEKLHVHYPHAKIDLLMKAGFETLFVDHPFVNSILLWEKSKDKYKHLRLLLKETRKTSYDLIINLQRFFATGLLTILSGASVTIGFDKNPLSLFFSKRINHLITLEKVALHEVDRNLSLIEPLTDNKKHAPKLYPSKHDYAKVSPFKTKSYVCLAPASLWFTKQFPTARWIEFLSAIPADIHVYMLGSKADIKLCDEILDKAKHPNSLNLAGKLSLLESAALMRDARMNYVNDSAPMHLCSSVNAPTTAIYCSTVPAFGFGPLSDDSVVVESPKQLSCRPCGLHGHRSCPEKHFDCAHSIDLNRLVARL